MLKDITSPVTGNKTFKTVLAIMVVAIIAYAIYAIYQSYKKAQSITGQLIEDKILAATLGITLSRLPVLRSRAKYLWDEAVTRPFYIVWLARQYNEDEFIKAINQCVSLNELLALNKFYQEVSGETLNRVVKDTFNSNDRARLNKAYLDELLKY